MVRVQSDRPDGGDRRLARIIGMSLAASLLAAGETHAAESPAPKWAPHIDLEGKGGTKRSLGEADLFIPLAQDGDTLLFSSLRTRMDDNDGAEGNFGLGVRHMLETGWNLGTYAYLDRRTIGRAACRERGCQYVWISVTAVYVKNKTK